MIYHIYLGVINFNKMPIVESNADWRFDGYRLVEVQRITGENHWKVGDMFRNSEWIFSRIKEDKQNSYVMIITKWQEGLLNNIKRDYSLESHVVCESPWITNPVHHDKGRNLKLIVLQHPEHPQRKEQ